MANPYKTAEEKKKKAPGGAAAPQEEVKAEGVVTTPPEPEEPQEAPETPVSAPVVEPEAVTEEEKAFVEQPPAHVRSLLEDLIPKEKKPKRGTYGFYLDSDVHDELVRLTKASKADNKSVYLNALLRRVFFGE